MMFIVHEREEILTKTDSLCWGVVSDPFFPYHSPHTKTSASAPPNFFKNNADLPKQSCPIWHPWCISPSASPFKEKAPKSLHDKTKSCRTDAAQHLVERLRTGKKTDYRKKAYKQTWIILKWFSNWHKTAEYFELNLRKFQMSKILMVLK